MRFTLLFEGNASDTCKKMAMKKKLLVKKKEKDNFLLILSDIPGNSI